MLLTTGLGAGTSCQDDDHAFGDKRQPSNDRLETQGLPTVAAPWYVYCCWCGSGLQWTRLSSAHRRPAKIVIGSAPSRLRHPAALSTLDARYAGRSGRCATAVGRYAWTMSGVRRVAEGQRASVPEVLRVPGAQCESPGCQAPHPARRPLGPWHAKHRPRRPLAP